MVGKIWLLGLIGKFIGLHINGGIAASSIISTVLFPG
jgi:hypothetical protein